MKRLILATLAASLGLALAGGALAQSVAMPKAATPEQVVAVRKFAMRANNSNLRDIRVKLERADTEGLSTPALNIAAIAQLVPYVFVERHEEAYPFKGSNKYFKGASQEQVQAEAEYLNAQARKLLRLSGSGDIKVLQGQFERIKRACVGCHKKMRGE